MPNGWKIASFLISFCMLSSYFLASSIKRSMLRQSSVGTNTTKSIDLKNHENIKELYQDLCHHYRPIIDITHPTAKFPDISLIVTINYDSVFKVIPLVEVMYRPFFRNIYYCAPTPGPEGLEFIDRFEKEGWNLTFFHPNPHPNPSKEWWWMLNYLCVDEVYRHDNYTSEAKTGYLFIGDDVLIPPANLKRLSLKRASRVAVAKHCDLNEEENRNCQNWVHYPRSKQVKTKLLQSLDKHTPETQELFNICTMAHRAITGFEDPLIVGSADIYFIPTRLMEKAVILVKLYAEYEIILEVAMPEILECLEFSERQEYQIPFTAETIEGISDWSSMRETFWQMVTFQQVISGRYEFMHPFKMSPLLDDEATEARQSFCQTVLPHAHQLTD